MPSIAGIAANLLQVTSAGEPSDPDSHPPQLGQDFCESPAGACPPVTLWDFQDVECRLRGNALDAIVTDFSAQNALRVGARGQRFLRPFRPAPASSYPATT